MQKEWLQLIHLKGLPLAAKRNLVSHFGSPAAVLQASPSMCTEVLTELANQFDSDAMEETGTRRKRRIPKIPAMKRENVDADIEALARIGGDFVGFNEPDFPPLLNQIQSAPLGLFVLGERALLNNPQLAIVGSRSPTPSGKVSTVRFAQELCNAGLTITSGMALGIDSSAHRGCLTALGKTIAVMATGIDVVYPRTNRSLHREIAENGLVVTEYPPGTPPKREYFPQRNRIISGLCFGTLVVEAGIRSGSLVTARLAGEQGREVFAVPGSIHVAVSRGCHQLLKQGAKLVETSHDILEEIGQFFTARPQPTSSETNSAPPKIPPNSESARLYNLIDYTPISTEQLIQQSELTPDKVSHILMQLELDGWVASTPEGYQRLPQ